MLRTEPTPIQERVQRLTAEAQELANIHEHDYWIVFCKRPGNHITFHMVSAEDDAVVDSGNIVAVIHPDWKIIAQEKERKIQEQRAKEDGELPGLYAGDLDHWMEAVELVWHLARAFGVSLESVEPNPHPFPDLAPVVFFPEDRKIQMAIRRRARPKTINDMETDGEWDEEPVPWDVLVPQIAFALVGLGAAADENEIIDRARSASAGYMIK